MKDFNLKERDVEPIVAALAGEQDALGRLLDAIARADDWDPQFDQRLDTIYRTRLRHLFAPRTHVDQLAEFARHLNVAATMVRSRSPSLASRLIAYESLVNDAVDEVDSGWIEEVLAKKHIKQLLDILAEAPGSEFGADELKQRANLETANLSRRLGLMESAGLIEKRYEGSFVRVLATDLGLKHAGGGTQPGDIRCVGFSERGAFIDRVDAVEGCLLERETGNLCLSSKAFPHTERVIQKERLVGFGLYPIGGPDTVFELYVDIASDDGEPRRLLLGEWKNLGAYQELLDWVENANAQIQRVADTKVLGREPANVLHRVMLGRALRYVPGRSMSSARIAAMAKYDPPWIDAVAAEVCRRIERAFEGAGTIRPRRQDWPDEETWEAIFDKICLPEDRIAGQVLDLCFEFLYLDPKRVGSYDIVRIGELNTCRFVYHRSNERFEAVADAIRDVARKEAAKHPGSLASLTTWPFSAFQHGLASVGLRAGRERNLPGQPWKICTHTATVSHNLLTKMENEGQVRDFDWAQVRSQRECADKIVEHPDRVVALCDNVIANDLFALWQASRRPADDLVAVSVELPAPVPIGIGVPKGEAEWKGLVHAAMVTVIKSERFRKDWEATAEGLRAISVALDRNFDPSTSTRKVLA